MAITKPQTNSAFFGPQQAPLSIWWWIVAPVAVFIIQLVLEATLSRAHIDDLVSEAGLYEIFQAVVAGFGACIAATILIRKDVRANKVLFAWVGIAFLGCFYITGE